ncbi:MAG: DNA-processing protein DprA [Flavobacteriales bacterium]
MKYPNYIYQIAFTQLFGIGPIRAKRLLKILDSPNDFFELSLPALQQKTSVSLKQLELTNRAAALLAAQTQEPYLCRNDIQYYFTSDPAFPKKLKECEDGPLGLFYRGTKPAWNQQRTLAIVGTRQESNYGKQLVKELLAALPKDILIVSGLAQGVDADVHEQALKCGLKTIGVLGHGLDRIYPAKHRDLALAMTKQGGLLSEFLIGTRAERMHFPMRNRIIAGLSDAVVVIESKKNGGSLITAELANDYNREVCAFPGAVHYPHSEGCNALIKANKAHLINDAHDLLKLLNWETTTPKTPSHSQLLNSKQQAIIQLFRSQNMWSIDELAIQLQKPVAEISTLLFELELLEQIQHFGANRYKLPI